MRCRQERFSPDPVVGFQGEVCLVFVASFQRYSCLGKDSFSEMLLDGLQLLVLKGEGGLRDNTVLILAAADLLLVFRDP
jgi:hypothetical protein